MGDPRVESKPLGKKARRRLGLGPPTEPQLYFRKLIEQKLDLLGVCRVVRATRDNRCRLYSPRLEKHAAAWLVGFKTGVIRPVGSGTMGSPITWRQLLGDAYVVDEHCTFWKGGLTGRSERFEPNENFYSDEPFVLPTFPWARPEDVPRLGHMPGRKNREPRLTYDRLSRAWAEVGALVGGGWNGWHEAIDRGKVGSMVGWPKYKHWV